jgi:hypothetical protein
VKLPHLATFHFEPPDQFAERRWRADILDSFMSLFFQFKSISKHVVSFLSSQKAINMFGLRQIVFSISAALQGVET